MFENLFSTIDLGPVQLRNRIFVSPHATMFASEGNNLPGKILADYCADRAKGGAALVEVSMSIVGNDTTSQVAPSSAAHFNILNAGHPMILTGRWPLRGSDPNVVEGYAYLAKRVHEYGAKCFIELASSGSNLGGESGVSAFPWPYARPFTSRQMTHDEIRVVAEDYAIAAKYVMEGGLDGVDILTAHGELIGEFLSKAMNRREDEYGGSLDNRMRLLLEVIRKIRDYVGESIAVGMRLNGDEKFENGNTPADAVEIAKRLDGKLDWITADIGYSPQQEDWQAVPMYVESGYNQRISTPLKLALKKTKIGAVGRYVDPYVAEKLIASGEADIVAMTRALIADPELPIKARDGRVEDIRPCIGALQDCWGRMIKGLPISCSVNPAVSREASWGLGTLEPSVERKTILIIGAGPAGLETARVAAERGHRVVIYEKSREAGGQVLLAAKIPARTDLRSLVTWQLQQLKKLGVEIRLGMDVTKEKDVIEYVLAQERPDLIIIATGSRPIRTGFQPYTFSEIDGWDSPIVCTEIDILEGKIELGRRVLVVDSLGFIEAPGVSEFIARKAKSEVTIVTPFESIALELKGMNHWDHLFPRLLSLGIRVEPFTWIRKIRENSVVAYNIYSKKEEKTVNDLDNVVLITGKQQNDELYREFKKYISETFLVGDARIGGARIGNAVFDGQKIGRTI
jgi:2,4-dienoyl-CoA reductase-like NADH-dependent reductase (Old Yellow Enzyme family)